MMQLQVGARTPSGPKFYSNYREGRKQSCCAHSWSSWWTRARRDTGTGWRWAAHRAQLGSLIQLPQPWASTHSSPWCHSKCPYHQPHTLHRLSYGFNSPDLTTKMPWRGALRTGETLMNPRCFWKISGKIWSRRAVQGSGESWIPHALNITVTIISDLHWNEFANY